ncbi:hypothetical protein [Agathobaculum sp.]|uniref:hypothetical protein n=1 Tax=Agathobaculum sp. TaxID=2048138 RepID=UPI0039A2605C
MNNAHDIHSSFPKESTRLFLQPGAFYLTLPAIRCRDGRRGALPRSLHKGRQAKSYKISHMPALLWYIKRL